MILFFYHLWVSADFTYLWCVSRIQTFLLYCYCCLRRTYSHCHLKDRIPWSVLEPLCHMVATATLSYLHYVFTYYVMQLSPFLPVGGNYPIYCCFWMFGALQLIYFLCVTFFINAFTDPKQSPQILLSDILILNRITELYVNNNPIIFYLHYACLVLIFV